MQIHSSCSTVRWLSQGLRPPHNHNESSFGASPYFIVHLPIQVQLCPVRPTISTNEFELWLRQIDTPTSVAEQYDHYCKTACVYSYIHLLANDTAYVAWPGLKVTPACVARPNSCHIMPCKHTLPIPNQIVSAIIFVDLENRLIEAANQTNAINLTVDKEE